MNTNQIKMLSEIVIRRNNQMVYDAIQDGKKGIDKTELRLTYYGEKTSDGCSLLFDDLNLNQISSDKKVSVNGTEVKIQSSNLKTEKNFSDLKHNIILQLEAIREDENNVNRNIPELDYLSEGKLMGFFIDNNFNPRSMVCFFFFLFPKPLLGGDMPFRINASDTYNQRVETIRRFCRLKIDGFVELENEEETEPIHNKIKESVQIAVIHDKSSVDIVKKIKQRYEILNQGSDSQRVEIKSSNLDDNSEIHDLIWLQSNEASNLEGLLVIVSDSMLIRKIKFDTEESFSMHQLVAKWGEKNSPVPIVIAEFEVVDLNMLKVQYNEFDEVLSIKKGDDGTGIVAIFKKSLLRYRELREEKEELLVEKRQLILEGTKIKEKYASIRNKIKRIFFGFLFLFGVSFFIFAIYRKCFHDPLEVDISDGIFRLAETPSYFQKPFYIHIKNDYLYVPSKGGQMNLHMIPISILDSKNPIDDLSKYQLEDKTPMGIIDMYFLNEKEILVSQDSEKGLMKITIANNRINKIWDNSIPVLKGAKSDAIDVSDDKNYAIVTFYQSDSIGIVNLNSIDDNWKSGLLPYDTLPNVSLLNPSGVRFIDNDNALVVFNSSEEKIDKIGIINVKKKNDAIKSVARTNLLFKLADIEIAGNFFITCSDDRGFVSRGTIPRIGSGDKYNTTIERLDFWNGSPTDISVSPDGKFCLVAHAKHPRIDLINIKKWTQRKIYTFDNPYPDNNKNSYLCRGIAVDWEKGLICLSDEGAREGGSNVYCVKLEGKDFPIKED